MIEFIDSHPLNCTPPPPPATAGGGSSSSSTGNPSPAPSLPDLPNSKLSPSVDKMMWESKQEASSSVRTESSAGSNYSYSSTATTATAATSGTTAGGHTVGIAAMHEASNTPVEHNFGEAPVEPSGFDYVCLFRL